MRPWIRLAWTASALTLGACSAGTVDGPLPLDSPCDGSVGAEESCAPAPPADCGATPHGEVESRDCYDANSVPAGATCTFTVQTRRCADGSWEQDFPACAHLACSVDDERTCGPLAHGEVETRACYASATVPHGGVCVATVQTRTCDHDDVWEPDWPTCDYLDCSVESPPPPPPPACDLAHPSGDCPMGQFCSVTGTCIDAGTCADDADCATTRVCHTATCTVASAAYAGDGPDVLGLNTMCDIFAPDPNPAIGYGGELAFQKCELALVLAKNLGVSWVRWGTPWYWMTNGQGSVPQVRLDFIVRVLEAARARGLKVLFQLTLPAPPYAYDPPNCDNSVPPVCEPSHLLDFEDAKFAAWLDELLEVTRPYTSFYELFNEVNYGGEGLFIPLDTSAGDNPRQRLMTRLKQLFELARARFDAARLRHPDWSPQLIASGFSYGEAFYDTDGYDGTGQLTSIAGLSVVSDLGTGTTSTGERFLGGALHALSVHPYWVTPGLHAPRLAELRASVDTATASSTFPVWASEVGYVKCDPENAVCCPVGPPCYWNSADEGVDYIDGLMQAVAAGSIQKLFWFVTHAWAGLVNNADSNQFGMYSEDGWAVRRPGQVTALREYARATRYDQRFTPPSPSAPALLELVDAPNASYESITGGTTTTLTYGGARVGAFAGTTEAGTSGSGLRMSFDDGVDYVTSNTLNVAVPATGIPTLRVSFGYAATAPSAAQFTFEIWVVGGQWPGNQVLFPFAKGKTGALETVELDLSQVRGTTINLVLRAHRTATLGPGQSADVVWVSPKLIDRGG